MVPTLISRSAVILALSLGTYAYAREAITPGDRVYVPGTNGQPGQVMTVASRDSYTFTLTDSTGGQVKKLRDGFSKILDSWTVHANVGGTVRAVPTRIRAGSEIILPSGRATYIVELILEDDAALVRTPEGERVQNLRGVFTKNGFYSSEAHSEAVPIGTRVLVGRESTGTVVGHGFSESYLIQPDAPPGAPVPSPVSKSSKDAGVSSTSYLVYAVGDEVYFDNNSGMFTSGRITEIYSHGVGKLEWGNPPRSRFVDLRLQSDRKAPVENIFLTKETKHPGAGSLTFGGKVVIPGDTSAPSTVGTFRGLRIGDQALVQLGDHQFKTVPLASLIGESESYGQWKPGLRAHALCPLEPCGSGVVERVFPNKSALVRIDGETQPRYVSLSDFEFENPADRRSAVAAWKEGDVVIHRPTGGELTVKAVDHETGRVKVTDAYGRIQDQAPEFLSKSVATLGPLKVGGTLHRWGKGSGKIVRLAEDGSIVVEQPQAGDRPPKRELAHVNQLSEGQRPKPAPAGPNGIRLPSSEPRPPAPSIAFQHPQVTEAQRLPYSSEGGSPPGQGCPQSARTLVGHISH
jgi:hypothetical protein